jgi:hypothetical protein
VRTAREFFDIVNAGGALAFERFGEQSGGPGADDGSYNHYNAEGSRSRSRKPRSKKWERGDAIVARYPGLRVCVKDQAVFLDGGSRTAPVSEIGMPVTPTQADAVVARLR